MGDDGKVLGTTQKGCYGGDRCSVDKTELPKGTSLIGHTHAPADQVESGGVKGSRSRIADLSRNVPGPGDAAPLKLGSGYVSAIVTHGGYRYVVEDSGGGAQLRYIGGGNEGFGKHVQKSWMPGMSDSQIKKIASDWFKK